MNQQALFELGSRQDHQSRVDHETGLGSLSPVRDSKSIKRLASLADRLQGAVEPVERAVVAAQIRDLAEDVLSSSIRDANEAGATWRELGSALSVPFQTLYRRYGAPR